MAGLISRSRHLAIAESQFRTRMRLGNSHGRPFNTADNVPGAVVLPGTVPTGVKWSTLGVLATNTAAQNSTALNALPTGTTIVADNPSGGIVPFNKWNLQSNLDIRGTPDEPCTLDCLDNIVGNSGSIQTVPSPSQSPINLSNITLMGLTFTKGAAFKGRLFNLAIDHFNFKNNLVIHHWGFMFQRGGDQEIAYNVVQNPLPADNSGMRCFGNSGQSVPITGGKPASVWVHDNYWQSHDGTYQIDQGPGGVNDTEADGYLFENNYALSYTGFSPGINAAGGTCFLFAGGTNPTHNVIVRGVGSNGLSGTPGGQGIHLSHDAIPVGQVGGGIYDMLFTDLVFDGSLGNGTMIWAESDDDHPGPIYRITWQNIVITNPKRSGVVLTGVTDSTLANIDIGVPSAARDPIISLTNCDSITLINLTLRGVRPLGTYAILLTNSSNIAIVGCTVYLRDGQLATNVMSNADFVALGNTIINV
jgi:hypothetical protein